MIPTERVEEIRRTFETYPTRPADAPDWEWEEEMAWLLDRVDHLEVALHAAKRKHERYCFLKTHNPPFPVDRSVCSCEADAHNAALTKALESEG